MYFINSSASWYHWAAHKSTARRYSYSLCMIAFLFGLYHYSSQLLTHKIQQAQQLIESLRTKQQALLTMKSQEQQIAQQIGLLRSSIEQLSYTINTQDNLSCIIAALNKAGLELVSIDHPQGACARVGQSTKEINCNLIGTMQQLTSFFDAIHAAEHAIAFDQISLTAQQGTQWNCQLRVQSVISCADLAHINNPKTI